MCKSEIPERANICHVCRSYQNRNKNRISYIASIGGFIGILIAAVTYVTTQLFSIYNEITWKDGLEIIYYDYGGTSLFNNIGDGDIFISHAEIYYRTEDVDRSIRHEIAKNIKRGNVLNYQNSDIDTKKGIFSTILAGKDNDIKFDIAKISALPRNDRCYWIIFKSVNHYDTIRTRKFYSDRNLTIYTKPGRAVFSIVSLKTGKTFDLEINLEGIIVRNSILSGC